MTLTDYLAWRAMETVMPSMPGREIWAVRPVGTTVICPGDLTGR